jgi:hypothetical protein
MHRDDKTTGKQIILALLMGLACLSVAEIAYQLNRYGSDRISRVFSLPQERSYPQLEPLLAHLGPGDTLIQVSPLRTRTLRLLAMRYHLNLIADPKVIVSYASRQAATGGRLVERKQIIDRIREQAHTGRVKGALLHSLYETIKDKHNRLYLLSPKNVNFTGDASLQSVVATDSMVLYRWFPAVIAKDKN